MKILKELKSSDHSVKYLLGLDDGNSVETLYMYDQARKLTYHSTLCVSSQVGCAMGCRFCATGEQGFTRNLEPEEILGQVEICDTYRSRSGCIPIDAVVFAGMGEPLLNYDSVTEAMRMIRDRFGIRSFELATVGMVPRIRSLAEDAAASGIRVRLNLSLHGSSDAVRNRLIPFTSKYGIDELIPAAADYAKTAGTKARIRYMLISGFNDSDGDAANLVALLEGKPLKLILSQYNDNHIKGLKAPSALDVLNFYNKIEGKIDCEIFHNFGSDIQGGCGQLKRPVRPA